MLFNKHNDVRIDNYFRIRIFIQTHIALIMELYGERQRPRSTPFMLHVRLLKLKNIIRKSINQANSKF